MTLKTKREAEKIRIREKILDAAEQVFFQKNYEHTTMEDIARTAQLSRALLYVYFKDKPAIMRGIMLRAGNALQTRFEKSLPDFHTGLERVEDIGHAYHTFSREEPDYFDVLTNIATFPSPDGVEQQWLAMDSCRERINNILVQALETGIRDGSVSPEQVPDPLQTAYYLQGALQGVIMQARSQKSAHIQYPDTTGLILYTIAMLGLSVKALET